MESKNYKKTNRNRINLTNYWLTFYIDKETSLCVLCGNTGIIETQPKNPTGILQKKCRTYCICPNGIEMRKHEIRID